ITYARSALPLPTRFLSQAPAPKCGSDLGNHKFQCCIHPWMRADASSTGAPMTVRSPPPAFPLLLSAKLAATFFTQASMRMSRLIGQLGISASLALALAACGNSTSSPAPSPAPPSSGATITIGAGGVSPSQVTISVGQTVTFVNNDTVAHDVESDPHPAHTDCPAINQVGQLQPSQSRQTGSLTTARTCGFHDHLNPGIAALKGSITI